MPQASDEQRDLMYKWFGDSVSDCGPMMFLESHGYTVENWQWRPPVPHHSVSCFELECIMFLQNEWDWGWLVGDKGKTVCLCGEGLGGVVNE